MRSLCELADFAFPATDEYCAAPRTRAGQQVGDAIADHVTFLQGNVQVSCCLSQQADFRLAATTAPPQSRNLSLGVMQAIVDPIEMPTGGFDLVEHGAVEKFERLWLQMAFCDSRLVRYHGYSQTKLVQRSNRLGYARQQLKLRRSEWSVDDACVRVVDEGVDHTVTIEQNRSHLLMCGRLDRAPSVGEILECVSPMANIRILCSPPRRECAGTPVTASLIVSRPRPPRSRGCCIAGCAPAGHRAKRRRR